MSGGEARLLGRWGEALVAQRLRRQGCRILASGYRSRFGEIDLIASDGTYLRFVEVKLRKSAAFAPGYAAVDARKREKLRATAQMYLALHPQPGLQPRFDVAEVYAPRGMGTPNPEFRYWENAF